MVIFEKNDPLQHKELNVKLQSVAHDCKARNPPGPEGSNGTSFYFVWAATSLFKSLQILTNP